MNRDACEKHLRQSLARLETCLETPRVPGELPSWISSVEQSLDKLEPHLMRQIDDVHQDEFVEIGEQDPGLLTRVEQLKAEDADIADEFAQLTRHVQYISAAASHVEPDELQLAQDVSDLVDQGLSFVLRVRKQETALTTWLLEAFDRDRGTVD